MGCSEGWDVLRRDFIGGVGCPEGRILVVSYYLGAAEIWSDKRMAFSEKVLIRGILLYLDFMITW